jgi:hypothetical protein
MKVCNILGEGGGCFFVISCFSITFLHLVLLKKQKKQQHLFIRNKTQKSLNKRSKIKVFPISKTFKSMFFSFFLGSSICQLSESFNEVLSDANLLDSSASKSKCQLASSGVMASRRPPSKRNKVRKNQIHESV